MGDTKTAALYQVGDYLMKDGDLYQITHVHARQYSMKKWELAGWSRTYRYGIKKTENDPAWEMVSKYKAKKILAGKFGLFIKEIKKLGVDTDPYIYWSGGWPWERDEKPKELLIGIQWTTGGITGGNCWQDSDETHYESMSSDPEPDLTELDTILEHLKPDITFLQYKKLCQELVERGEHRQNEYYGNYTDYAHKYVRLKRLYSYLKDKGWLPQHLVEE